MNLAELRKKIAFTDEKILTLVSERLHIASEIGKVKKESGTPVLNKEVEDAVISRYRNFAEEEGIDPDAAEELAVLLMTWSKKIQE
ncbi:MAG: chorismate mutase [Candidatus Methanomethylophilaceae archaeon]|jgi:chorismate mutase